MVISTERKDEAGRRAAGAVVRAYVEEDSQNSCLRRGCAQPGGGQKTAGLLEQWPSRAHKSRSSLVRAYLASSGTAESAIDALEMQESRLSQILPQPQKLPQLL